MLIEAQSRASISGYISDQFGNLPGAIVNIEGTDISTTTDVNGYYLLELEEGEYVINVNFVMYEPLSKSVTLRVGDKIELNLSLVTGFSIDQPVSLGSRDKPRSLLQTTAPIDIISPQKITNSSQVELSHILHYLVPSFNSTNQTIADGTDHIDPASLRGLGPDQLLVLINGKRRHNSALLNLNGTVGRGTVGTDFNAIPVSSIERIEILRDGATSQYGSDAIAGVVNIILKKQLQAIDINAHTGINTEGDGKTNYFSTNFGLKVGDKGFINVTGEYRSRESTNRAGNYTGNVYSDDAVQDAQLISSNNFYGQTGYSGNRVMEIGNAETQNLALSFNGELPIHTNAEFYFHGGRNYREGKAKGFYRFPKDKDRVVSELFPNGFSPQILTDIQDDAIALGLRGVKNGWNTDFSHAIGSNHLDYTVNNSNNASLGIASPRAFYSGGFLYNQNTTNFDISKTYNFLSGINLAFGAEHRVENYQIIAGEEASYINGGDTYVNDLGDTLPRISGAQVFPGIQPNNELNRFRTNSAAYADIETNLSEKVLIKTAVRHEFYNDFGGQTIWKISGRYRISKEISFRTGYSTGFRAPSLHQVFFQNISTQFVNGDILQVGTFNNESAVAREGFHIPKLKPELSKHFSAGFSGKLKSNLSFTFDYYMITIDDRIVLSSLLSTGYESVLAPFNVGAAQFFVNAIDSKTSGADVALFYKSNIKNGEFNASVGANYSTTKVIGDVKAPSAFFIGKEEQLFDRGERARVEFAQPNYKLSSTLSYEFKKIKFEISNTYFGEVKFIHPDDGDPSNWVMNELSGKMESRDQTFRSKVITDLSISYQVTNVIRFTIGGNNIFDIYPDKHTHSANINRGNFVYSRRVQQFGLRGANYFTRLSIRL